MYLHGLPDKVIHRDCKSKNVLIELVPLCDTLSWWIQPLVLLSHSACSPVQGSGHEAARIQTAKLCDFGVSKVVTESTQADTSIGTSRYRSLSFSLSLSPRKCGQEPAGRFLRACSSPHTYSVLKVCC
jgi:serine/threonine protein kinase